MQPQIVDSVKVQHPESSTNIECWISQHSSILVGGLILLFFFVGVFTLHDYGLTWDEGLGNLFFGERYLHFFTTFNLKYLDFQADLASLSNYPLHLYLSPFRNTPQEFPPLADTLSAATMYLFSYTLKWLDPVSGFHLFNVILSTVFLWLFYQFAVGHLGKLAAFLSVLFLGTFPRFWADLHFNVKDVPEAILFGLVIMVFWQWSIKPGWLLALATGLLFGSALSVKANAIVLPFILLVAIFPLTFRAQSFRKFFNNFKNHAHHCALMAMSSIGFYILSWPYLYENPIRGLKSYWGYIFSQGGRIGSSLWNIDPVRQVVTTFPEIMLIFFVIGLVLASRKAWTGKPTIWRLLLLWTLIPIFRASVPYTVNFDGIRHFLEFVPAASLIAGFGASWILDRLKKTRRVPKLVGSTAVLLLICYNLLQINMTYAPYQYLYYNQFIGGLPGARDSFLGSEASDYWVSSYRQGMEWLNQNAPPNSYVQALIAPWTVELSGPVFLRPDIQVVPSGELPDFSVMRKSSRPYFLMFILKNAGSNQDEANYTRSNGELVHKIILDRVPILEIYRFGG